MKRIIAGALVASLSFSAMADCQPVGLDQNGIQLYRCDQPVVVQQSQPVYQAQSQMSSTEGMVIGALGGIVVGSILAGDRTTVYNTSYHGQPVPFRYRHRY
jgi:hypothetical protein